jgi:NAD(P)-dependent dehydrogenase (short-subunit alcohol dehydrogenase family)
MPEIDALLANPETAALVSPMGRVGTAEEMAQALLHLASPESSYTNGAILVIDGGSTA